MARQRRAVANPLALAVMVTLSERPMHPYEMAATMRRYGKERNIRLNYGSLYTVVNNLAKHSFIEAVEARREGRRPERTVYRLTEAGQHELDDWMSELISIPVKEYPQFEAALSELPVVPPERVLALLRERTVALEKAVGQERAELDAVRHLPRLFLLEGEYHLAMLEAELAWIRALAAELADGSFPNLEGWRQLHEMRAAGQLPPDVAELLATWGQAATWEDSQRAAGDRPAQPPGREEGGGQG
jgi:DNA-binding PadR family transcriptional regulator